MSRDDADGQTMGFRNSDEVRNFQDKSMTTPSHTELAAQAKELATKASKMGARIFADEIITCLRACAASLESPERVLINGLTEDETAATASVVGLSTPPTAPAQDAQGDAVRTQLEWFALAAHWYINASDRELAEQGQARGDALKQVHLLSGHLEASGFKFATPSPQAEKQPLSDEQIFHARNWLWKNHGVSFSDRTLLDLFELVGIVTKESST